MILAEELLSRRSLWIAHTRGGPSLWDRYRPSILAADLLSGIDISLPYSRRTFSLGSISAFHTRGGPSLWDRYQPSILAADLLSGIDVDHPLIIRSSLLWDSQRIFARLNWGYNIQAFGTLQLNYLGDIRSTCGAPVTGGGETYYQRWALFANTPIDSSQT
jgi:hypothetical protein